MSIFVEHTGAISTDDYQGHLAARLLGSLPQPARSPPRQISRGGFEGDELGSHSSYGAEPVGMNCSSSGGHATRSCAAKFRRATSGSLRRPLWSEGTQTVNSFRQRTRTT